MIKEESPKRDQERPDDDPVKYMGYTTGQASADMKCYKDLCTVRKLPLARRKNVNRTGVKRQEYKREKERDNIRV